MIDQRWPRLVRSERHHFAYNDDVVPTVMVGPDATFEPARMSREQRHTRDTFDGADASELLTSSWPLRIGWGVSRMLDTLVGYAAAAAGVVRSVRACSGVR